MSDVETPGDVIRDEPRRFNDGPAPARFLNEHAPGCRFADHLRGRDVDFDQYEPPDDGGLPLSDAIVVPRAAR